MQVVPGRARLVVLSGDHAGQVYPVHYHCILGRSEEVEFMLPSPHISRQHARIDYQGEEGWTIEDMGSANGTTLDGIPVQGPTPLTFGARILLGGSVLLIFTHHDVLEEQILQMQKLESLGRLAGEVAHDLRNLLTVYQYNVGVLEEALEQGQLLPVGDLTPLDLQETVTSLTEVTNRASGLTGRLLGFARTGPGSQTAVDVTDLVDRLCSMLQGTLPNNIKVKCHVAGSNMVVSGVEERLHQALMNLCINARDAMPEGGELSIGMTCVPAAAASLASLPLSGGTDYIMLTVKDTGAGMDDTTQGQIFEPFFTTKGKGRGTGLGLATVYAVVRDHGGHIAVKSMPGKGTEFGIALPRASDAGTRWQKTYNNDEEDRSTSMSAPRNVLVISRRQEGRRSLAACINGLAFEPLWEENLQAGMSRIMDEWDGLAAILLDTDQGEQPLSEVARALRRAAPAVPMILLERERHDGQTLPPMASAAGVHAVLQPPVTRERLRQTIAKAIDRSMSAA